MSSNQMPEKQKKEIKINGFVDLGSLKVGGNAVITIDGQLMMTGPILKYSVIGSQVFIETENTVYRT